MKFALLQWCSMCFDTYIFDESCDYSWVYVLFLFAAYYQLNRANVGTAKEQDRKKGNSVFLNIEINEHVISLAQDCLAGFTNPLGSDVI